MAMVKIYTTSTCAYCHALMDWLDSKGVKYVEKDATKEKAIEALCRHLKITSSQIAAFGDDFNDIGMLKLCIMSKSD